MKVFGYKKKEHIVDGMSLLELKEVSFCTDPKTLKDIAGFLVRAANELEKDPENFDHLHLRDEIDSFNQDKHVDIIVANPTLGDNDEEVA